MSKVVFALSACIALTLFAGFVWQNDKQKSEEAAAENHLTVASTLDKAVSDGVEAGAILTQYVQTGDAALLPQMQAKTDDGVRGLTEALTLAGRDPGSFIQTGSQIVQRSGEVIALRQSGDVAGAGAVLTALGEDYAAFIAVQQEFIQSERTIAAESTASADDAGQLSELLLLAAGGVMVIVVCSAIVSVLRREEEPAGTVPA